MARPLDLRLGVDVGGTNTDAVVLDRNGSLLSRAKVPTTADPSGGIAAAIAAVVADLGEGGERISHAMLGTTHATNAILERRRLQRVAVLRIGAPATLAIRPLYGWPSDLREAISAGEEIVRGGFEFDGRELVPLDTDAIARFAGSMAGRAETFAVAGVFAPVSAAHELAALEIIRREVGDVPVSLSHEIGHVGLLERENATVLNASLGGVAGAVAGSFTDALGSCGLRPETFFAQNDGTLMALEYALRFPVLTIGSGPANSLRGAAYLTGASDAMVIDVGGTSSDIGVLANGFPRESGSGVEIGGIRTNFRMPDLVTIAVGGGSIVHADAEGVRVGPDSVGYRLTSEALVFGGSTPTLTDAAAAAGRLTFDGDAGARDDDERRSLVEGLRVSDEAIADAVDRAKTSRAPQPLIAVGGGAALVPERLEGIERVERPAHGDVANAIGAAIASVSGEVDRIFNLGPEGRRAAVDEATAQAVDRAVAAGASRERVEVVQIEELPLTYLSSPALQIRAKAAGPLDTRAQDMGG